MLFLGFQNIGGTLPPSLKMPSTLLYLLMESSNLTGPLPPWPLPSVQSVRCGSAVWAAVHAWLLWQLGTRDSRGCHCCVEYHAPTAVLRLASDPQLWGALVTPVPKTAPLQINLIGNQLTGSIPDEWTKLPSLAIMSACAVQLWPRSSPDPFLAIMSVCAVQICPSSPLSCNPACNPAWSLAICTLSAAIQRRHSAAPGVGRVHTSKPRASRWCRSAEQPVERLPAILNDVQPKLWRERAFSRRQQLQRQAALVARPANIPPVNPSRERGPVRRGACQRCAALLACMPRACWAISACMQGTAVCRVATCGSLCPIPACLTRQPTASRSFQATRPCRFALPCAAGRSPSHPYCWRAQTAQTHTSPACLHALAIPPTPAAGSAAAQLPAS